MKGGIAEQRAVLQRFVEAATQDGRVVAAFLGGSLVTDRADEWSDLDIYLIVEDEAYDDFFAGRHDFVRKLGDPVLLEDFNAFGFDMVLFTFEDGAEGELALARESRFEHIHGGPHEVLVDKKGVLEGKMFALYRPAEEDQRREVRDLIYSFWESASYFIKAMNRGQLWTAYGSLDEMRMKCLKLARLQRDFNTEQTAYSKVQDVLPEEELAELAPTCCTLEAEAMREAASVLVRFYKRVAPAMSAEHGIAYPDGLERVVMARGQRSRRG
jgi:predicted nucleotidyltransferase